MQCYSEIVPPSGVTHSLHIPFTSVDASNLVVVRTSLLQIFSHTQVNHGQDTKLLLVAEFHLSGTVTSLGRVNLLQSKGGGEALLIAFRDAKLSLVEWDPTQNSISTISIHYYENHDLLQCPWVPETKDCANHLTIDPSSRCAAFNFGIHNMAIVPFHQQSDDLAMDDFDDVEEEKSEASVKQANEDSNTRSTPYAPSFVLPLTVLDPSLIHPIDLTFLHEYRDPTLGILYSTISPSNNMAPERKDVMIYTVYTLDIEQRASTTLLTISSLPNDLYKAIALPLPVGGTLLLGGNEVIHVDQGGKTNAVGVNEFAKDSSSFPMADRSEYRMRLEGCQIEQLGNSTGDMLLILSSGELVVLSFRLDGRTVSGLTLRPIFTDFHLTTTISSTMAHIGFGRVFIGSEESDSILIGTTKRVSQLKRGSSKVHVKAEDEDDFDLNGNDIEDEDDDDDDLYAGDHVNGTNGHAVDGSNFRLLDQLPSIAPINDVTFGRPAKRKRDDEQGEFAELNETAPLEIAMACCRGRAGGLAFLSREIVPHTVKRTRYDTLSGVWSIKTQNDEGETAESNIDDTVILTQKTADGEGKSSLMTLLAGELKIKHDTDFDNNTMTINIGRLASSNHTIQVSTNDVRVYDADFGLSQIFPIVDEDSDETAQAISACCVEPYVLITKDNETFVILKADKNGELDEVDLPANIPSQSIACASLYRDSTDFFGTSKYQTESPGDFILLSVFETNGTFSLYSLPDLKIQVFQYHGLDYLPPSLSPDAPIPKHWKIKDEVVETMIADVGDKTHRSPFLIARNSTGDVTVYQPYSVPGVEGSFRFQKTATANADVTDDADDEYDPDARHPQQNMHSLSNINGYAGVFVTGTSPSMILKTASSACRIHRFHASNIKHVSSVNDPSCPDGILFIDGDDSLNFSSLPTDVEFGLSDYVVRKVPLNQEVNFVSYYDRTQSYLLGVNYPINFQLPQDDEWHPEWTEENTEFLPSSYQSSLQLMSSKSNKILHTYPMDANEQILTLKTLNLSVSEESGERKDLIVVGTAVTKGENVVTRGNIYIFDIVDVVPHPDIPESDLRIKLITKEDVRGSASAITDIGAQGFLLASQGQKAMVRGLKEDKTLLPVGFLDMRFHVSVARELKGTGLTILGDAFSGLWLMGYSEEPYKMQILGRDLEDPEVVSADFLPQGKELYIFSSDSDGELRILQYDPENPKTERGSKLLLRSTFNTGDLPTTITLVPRTPTSSERPLGPSKPFNSDSDYESMDVDYNPTSSSQSQHSTHQLLLTTLSGALCLITPLAEQSYRRLSTLSNILTSNLSHHAGLNPRAYRNIETDGIGGRAMIDGNLVKRWLIGSSWHKKTLADKVGGTVWEVRGDLEGVGGGGLGFV